VSKKKNGSAIVEFSSHEDAVCKCDFIMTDICHFDNEIHKKTTFI